MTFQYRNVFVEDASTIAGPYEAEGPLKKYFDKTFDNLYHGEKTWETAEVKVLADSIDTLLKKTKRKQEEIDLIISGDLLNLVIRQKNLDSHFLEFIVLVLLVLRE